MDIKVITRHAPSNYGSLLQSIATQTVLERLGHKCEIIDYVRDDEHGLKAVTTALDDKEGWNAYSPTQGQLTLTAVEPCAIAIYSIDGKQVHCSQVTTTTTLQLASGIYIAASGSTSKKVIVK